MCVCVCVCVSVYNYLTLCVCVLFSAAAPTDSALPAHRRAALRLQAPAQAGGQDADATGADRLPGTYYY